MRGVPERAESGREGATSTLAWQRAAPGPARPALPGWRRLGPSPTAHCQSCTKERSGGGGASGSQRASLWASDHPKMGVRVTGSRPPAPSFQAQGATAHCGWCWLLTSDASSHGLPTASPPARLHPPARRGKSWPLCCGGALSFFFSLPRSQAAARHASPAFHGHRHVPAPPLQVPARQSFRDGVPAKPPKYTFVDSSVFWTSTRRRPALDAMPLFTQHSILLLLAVHLCYTQFHGMRTFPQMTSFMNRTMHLASCLPYLPRY